MAVNFSPLDIGLSALRASQLGLSIAGQNIANVNTPGYTRQEVELSPTPPVAGQLAGAGVTIDGALFAGSIESVDFARASTDLVAAQTAVQAVLQSDPRLNGKSLLDFIGQG
jgi:flagellar hook-associated protein 1 FlgK